MYGLMHVAVTLGLWRNAGAGVLALCCLCSGDGAADIVGRRYGRHKWRHAPSKSVEGSAAFVGASVVTGVAFLKLFGALGFFEAPASAWAHVLAVSSTAAAVESLPFADVDNVTVVAAAVTTSLALGS